MTENRKRYEKRGEGEEEEEKGEELMMGWVTSSCRGIEREERRGGQGGEERTVERCRNRWTYR